MTRSRKSSAACSLPNRLVEQERFPNVFDFRYRAFQVKGLGEHDLEDLEMDQGIDKHREALRPESESPPAMSTHLLHIDAVTGAAEDQTRPHGLGEAPSLLRTHPSVSHERVTCPINWRGAVPDSRSLLGPPAGS